MGCYKDPRQLPGSKAQVHVGFRPSSLPTPSPERCTMCGGPFHPATGHWESEVRHWCHCCTHEMVALLKEQLPRRVGRKAKGLRFYDYAAAPPAVAPAGFRPEDV